MSFIDPTCIILCKSERQLLKIKRLDSGCWAERIRSSKLVEIHGLATDLSYELQSAKKALDARGPEVEGS